MLAYLVRRAFLAILTMWAVSVLSFVVIQLPSVQQANRRPPLGA